MTEFDPAPEPETTQRRWQEGTDTFGRVYEVALGVTSPTPHTKIAELADCSPNAAKKHLDRLSKMGIVRANTESRPPQYERNEGYLEWQVASHIAEDLPIDTIIDRVQELEEQHAEFQERFGVESPTDVAVFEQGDHETIHEQMAAISDWQGILRDIRLYDLARQLSQNDGHLIPA